MIPNRKVTTWHIIITFLFPLLYFLNAILPWASGLWVAGNREFYIPYWISICILHCISVLLVMRFLKKDGLSLRDIGYNLGKSRSMILVISLILVGLAIFFFTESLAPKEIVVNAGIMSMFYPITTAERLVWILVCLIAGFSEELVYRGYNISMLRYKAVNKWLALFLSIFPFILIHSFAPIFSGFLFGMYFSFGLTFGLIYILTKRLWIPMAVHCIYNLTAMMAVLG